MWRARIDEVHNVRARGIALHPPLSQIACWVFLQKQKDEEWADEEERESETYLWLWQSHLIMTWLPACSMTCVGPKPYRTVMTDSCWWDCSLPSSGICSAQIQSESSICFGGGGGGGWGGAIQRPTASCGGPDGGPCQGGWGVGSVVQCLKL